MMPKTPASLHAPPALRRARPLLALALAALAFGSPLAARAERVAKPVPDYTVFLDPPSGFVFVKLPTGWKFVGAVDAKQAARRPPNVVTALLTDDVEEEIANRLAERRGR